MKEDHGIYLKIEGIDLPATYEIDFSNERKNGTSVTMIGNADGVLIPTQFIKSGKDVFAFLYHVGEDYGKTVYTFCIPNRIRPDRTNEQPEPEQQSVIDQTIAALNTAVAQTAQDVLDADASAQSAAESAENAAQSASQAAESATNAEASKQAAAQSETNAASSASAANSAATSAGASAASAYADAERAEQAANNAGYLDVEIVDGRLIYTRTDAVDVDFALNNGRLIMEAI
jgi:type IV secretory pathway VirB10-like protein